MNKHEKKYQNTALKMEEALLSLMRTQPFESISVSELCHAADVNRSTFYAHYSNTADLLRDIHQKKVNNVLKEVDMAVWEQHHNVDVRDRIILPYLKEMIAHKDVAEAFVHQSPELMSLLGESALTVELHAITKYYGITDTARSDYVTSYFVGGIYSILNRWIQRNYEDTPEEVAEIIINCLNSELRNLKNE